MSNLDIYQPLDFFDSDDPAEIDAGIKETIRSIHFSVLAMGLGLVKIKSKHLYIKMGHESMNEYINHLSREMKTDSSGIYKWMKIGKAFIKYKDDLEMFGFRESHGPIKLRYLERALTAGDKEEVYENIKKMSVRDFIDYSKSAKTRHPKDAPDDVLIKGSIVYIKGRRGVIVSNNLGEKITKYYLEIMKVASEALKKGGRIIPVHVRNKKEDERFRQIYGRIMSELRNKK